MRSRRFDIHGLPRIGSIDDISVHAGVPRQRVVRLLFGSRPYRTFRIPKASGGFRQIAHPIPSLRAIQRWVLRHILDRLQVTSSCYGFERGSSLRVHAAQHIGARAVLSLDLKDFFPSVSIARAVRVFRASGYDPPGALVLAGLCTLSGALPQGAPTSPKLANLACFRLDRRLSGLAAQRGLVYTRYADDLSFSGPSAAALVKVQPIVGYIVRDCGFRLNSKKTRLLGASRARTITGLVLTDTGVGIGRRRLRELRARIHRVHANGSVEELASIQGWLDFISDVDLDRYRTLIRYVERLKRASPASVISALRVRA